jgi:membrane-bound serine protease (ClpP class)
MPFGSSNSIGGLTPILRRGFTLPQALVLALALLIATSRGAIAAPGDRVLMIEVDGAIGVAAARQISRAVEQGNKESAAAIVIRLDTPGGLVSATRDIIRHMIAGAPMLVPGARLARHRR